MGSVVTIRARSVQVENPESYAISNGLIVISKHGVIPDGTVI